MSEDDALDVAAEMEAAGIAPGLVRRELRARGADEDTIGALAPAWSPCGIHEHDREVVTCSRCEAFAIEIRADLDRQLAGEDAATRTKRTKAERKLLRAA